MSGATVLPLFSRPREKDYRACVAKIIRELKARHGLTNTELAEEIGCCKETIENAENEHSSLNPVAFGSIRWRFGPEAVQPWTEICDGRVGEPETLTDRLDALQQQIAAVRQEIGA